MFGALALAPKTLDQYAPIIGDDQIARLRDLARPLRGARILNLSVTSFSTGVADILTAAVPLLSDLGIDAQWQVVRCSDEFTPVNRAMYAALGGTSVVWNQEMTDTWTRYSDMNASQLTEPLDIVVVHDPQPAAICTLAEPGIAERTKWVLHSHLDLSTAQQDVWLLLKGHIDRYDRVVFPFSAFARDDIRAPLTFIEPAIDPLSPRNTDLSDEVVAAAVSQYGIDAGRPLVVQISPMAPGLDMEGAVRVCELASAETPGLQLLLAPLYPPEDPASRAYCDEVARRSIENPNIYFIPREIGHTEINAFQRAADVVLQRGLAKGFGPWITDALWKRKAVVAPSVHGLGQQVMHGETGLCPVDDASFAAAITLLIHDPGLSRRLGDQAHDLVRQRFLITRFVEDQLRLFADLLQEQR